MCWDNFGKGRGTIKQKKRGVDKGKSKKGEQERGWRRLKITARKGGTSIIRQEAAPGRNKHRKKRPSPKWIGKEKWGVKHRIQEGEKKEASDLNWLKDGGESEVSTGYVKEGPLDLSPEIEGTTKGALKEEGGLGTV